MLTECECREAAKREHILFKNIAKFKTVEEMQAMITAAGGTWKLFSENSVPASNVISGNCIVLKRIYSHHTHSRYLCYFLGVTGQLELIRQSLPFAGSRDAAVNWLSSETFKRNKIDILARNDMPIHEEEENLVLLYCHGDRNHSIYLKHRLFFDSFNQWKSARRDEEINRKQEVEHG